MGVSNSQSQVFSSFQLSQFTFLIWTLYLHTPSFFLLLLAFQPHLQTPKWFWQMQECTNATGVINNRVYYCRFGKSFKCWGTFPVAMPCVAARAVTVVKCQLQYLWTLMNKKKKEEKKKKKSLSLRELASHRLPAAFKFQPKKPLNSSVLTVECGQAS